MNNLKLNRLIVKNIITALGGPGSGPRPGEGSLGKQASRPTSDHFDGKISTEEIKDFHTAYSNAVSNGTGISQEGAFKIYNNMRSSGLSRAGALRNLVSKISAQK